MTDASDQAANNESKDNRFEILKIYLKDLSYESPLAPGIFTKEADWRPEINLQLNAESHPLGDDLYEVVLDLNVSQRHEDKVILMVEIKQAGVFRIKGFEKPQLGHMLGAYCPNLLFPYAREVVSDVVNKGGLPQLVLQPINFDALYAQHLEKVKQSAPAPETKQ